MIISMEWKSQLNVRSIECHQSLLSYSWQPPSFLPFNPFLGLSDTIGPHSLYLSGTHNCHIRLEFKEWIVTLFSILPLTRFRLNLSVTTACQFKTLVFNNLNLMRISLLVWVQGPLLYPASSFSYIGSSSVFLVISA